MYDNYTMIKEGKIRFDFIKAKTPCMHMISTLNFLLNINKSSYFLSYA